MPYLVREDIQLPRNERGMFEDVYVQMNIEGFRIGTEGFRC